MGKGNNILMVSRHFVNNIVPKIISPVIENVECCVSKEFIEATQFVVKKDTQYFDALARVYEEKRDWLRDKYWGNRQVDGKSHLIDMHKIAAVLCRAVISCKPFSFDVKKAEELMKQHEQDLNWIVNNYLSNYRVAVDVAMLTCFYDMVDRLGCLEKDPLKASELYGMVDVDGQLRELVDRGGLDYYSDPILPQQHEPYYNSLVYSVAMNDTHKRDFDYLGFAINCFQLQQYNVLSYNFRKLKETKC